MPGFSAASAAGAGIAHVATLNARPRHALNDGSPPAPAVGRRVPTDRSLRSRSPRPRAPRLASQFDRADDERARCGSAVFNRTESRIPMAENNDERGGSEAPGSPATAGNAGGAQAGGDLSAQIVGTVERQRRRRRRSLHARRRRSLPVQLVGARGGRGLQRSVMPGLLVTTHRVRQSQFMRVTRTSAGKLSISILGASSN